MGSIFPVIPSTDNICIYWILNKNIFTESVKLSEKYKTDRSTNELREKTKLERNSNIDLRQKINIDRQKAEKLRLVVGKIN